MPRPQPSRKPPPLSACGRRTSPGLPFASRDRAETWAAEAEANAQNLAHRYHDGLAARDYEPLDVKRFLRGRRRVDPRFDPSDGDTRNVKYYVDEIEFEA